LNRLRAACLALLSSAADSRPTRALGEYRLLVPEPREDQLRPNALASGEFDGSAKALIPLVGAPYVDQGSAETIATRRGEFGEVCTCSVGRFIAYMPFRRSRLTRRDVRSLHRAKPARLSIAIAAFQRGSDRFEESGVIGAVSRPGNVKSPGETCPIASRTAYESGRTGTVRGAGLL
jgi:hypothetical protein